MFGILIYLIFISKDFFEKFKYPTFLISLLLMVSSIYIILGFQYNDLFSTLMIGFLLLVCKRKTRVNTFLFENRTVIFLGEISYSIYLIHMLIIEYLPKQIILFNNPYFILVATIGISTIIYYCIERPFFKFGKSIFVKRNIPELEI